ERVAESVPPTGHRWRPTRQPVVLSEWRPGTPYREVYTTVMNWTSYKCETYGGRTYGHKDVEFLRFPELPRRVAPAVLDAARAPRRVGHAPPGPPAPPARRAQAPGRAA